jgi:hypothetical protein
MGIVSHEHAMVGMFQYLFLINMLWVLCFKVCFSLTCDGYYVLSSVSHEHVMGLILQCMLLMPMLWEMRFPATRASHKSACCLSE